MSALTENACTANVRSNKVRIVRVRGWGVAALGEEFWMKLVAMLPLGVLAVAVNAALIPTVLAESRTPVEATAHALDELANLCAQRRPECPPTVTLTPTWTPSPTSTGTPLPTDTPTPTPTASATPTAEPCWFTDQELGDPDNGFIVFDADGAPIPCPTDNQAALVAADTPTPTTAPTAATPQPTLEAEHPQTQQQVRVVVQTVVVLVTAVPTETPLSTVTAAPTFTPRPTPSATSTRTPPAAPTGTATVIPATGRQTPSESATSDTTPPVVDWSLLGKLISSAVALLAAVGIGVAIKRRTVVRKPRPPRGETYA